MESAKNHYFGTKRCTWGFDYFKFGVIVVTTLYFLYADRFANSKRWLRGY
jgi:hypothetical protein